MKAVLEDAVGKKRQPDKREPLDQRVLLLASESWVERADARAASLGLSLSAYIRMVVERDLQDAEARP
jgi:hypothetical protein